MSRLLEEAVYCFMDADPNDTTWHTVQSSRWLRFDKWNRVTVIAFKTVGAASFAMRLRVADNAGGTTNVTTVGSTTSTTGGEPLNSRNIPGSLISANVARCVIDLTADEIAADSSTAQYLSAEIVLETGTDECGVLYIFSEPRYRETIQSDFDTGGRG